MSEFDFEIGIECPEFGSRQTEDSSVVPNHWFCFLCGTIWNPAKELVE